MPSVVCTASGTPSPSKSRYFVAIGTTSMVMPAIGLTSQCVPHALPGFRRPETGPSAGAQPAPARSSTSPDGAAGPGTRSSRGSRWSSIERTRPPSRPPPTPTTGMSFLRVHRVAILTTVVVAAVLAAGTVPAVAQDASGDDPAVSGNDPAVSGNDPAVSVAIELFRTRTRLDEVSQQVADAEGRLAAAQAALAESEQKIAANKAKIDELRSELEGRAAVAYTSQGQQLDALLAVEKLQDIAVSERYTDAAAGDGNRKLDQLNAVEAQLEQERARRDAARQSIADEKARLDKLRADLDAVRARDEVMLDRMGGVPIMGDSRLTPEQIAAWYHSTGATPHLAPGTTIDDLARVYVEEGAAEHVRGDIAFAQAVVETGSFGEAPDNNFAGIGTCDSCANGYAFPTPRDGVRAQIQLLRSYADPDSRAANLANRPEPGVFGGDPLRAVVAYDSFGLKGAAPLWNVMGDGNWATDPDYAPKVLEVYARMLGYNALHR